MTSTSEHLKTSIKCNGDKCNNDVIDINVDYCYTCLQTKIMSIIKTIKDNLDDYYAKYPLQYKKLDKSQSKRSIAIKLAIANHTRAKKILFTLLETNIESWWD